MNIENNEYDISDCPMTDEELQNKHEIRPSLVFVPRLSESVFLTAGGNIRSKSPDFDEDSDASTIALDASSEPFIRFNLNEDDSTDEENMDYFTDEENVNDSADEENVDDSTDEENVHDSTDEENVDDSTDEENVDVSMDEEVVNDSTDKENVNASTDEESKKFKDRPFSIHYSNLFLKEVACNIYKLYSWNLPVKLGAVFAPLDSKYCTLTKDAFRKKVLDHIETLVYDTVMKEFESEFLCVTDTFLEKVVQDNMNAMFPPEDKLIDTPYSVKVNTYLAKLVLNSNSQFDEITNSIFRGKLSNHRKILYHENNYIMATFVKTLIYKEAISKGARCKVAIKPSDISNVTAFEHYMNFRRKFYKSRYKF